jgi:hypothetical protein|tara:strand:- start:725 stop:895 length:171 start_codon:yes stop_codon:yes gene_type:complete
MIRTLKDGTQVPAIDIAVELKVITKCPTKWRLIDDETGIEYRGKFPQEGEMHWQQI